MSEVRNDGGDGWRWDVYQHPTPQSVSINVIEPPENSELPRRGERVPFGFGPRECEWEGNPS